MRLTGTAAERFARVKAAFENDGFSVKRLPDPRAQGRMVDFLSKDGGIGVLALHRSARNAKTGEPKKAFYVEGDNYTMGWLLGCMAEPHVSRMANEFVENVAFAFFDAAAAERGGLIESVKELFVAIIANASESTLSDVPPEYREEIHGMVDGCTAANPATRVSAERLVALNFGIDLLLAHVYSGTVFAERHIHPRHLRTPIGCNAFSVSGAAAGGRHFFGRDFMFPTADVFQDTACMILYNPQDLPTARRQAFVSQAAPGFVGTMAAMNGAGVAIGVDMLPTRLCDPARPGFNSLPLIRDCIQYCASAGQVVQRIVEAQRGVTWLYAVADRGGAAYAIEAGRKLPTGDPFPYFASVPRYYRRRLPGIRYIARMRRKYGTPAPRKGLIARSSDYRYPSEYLADWNARLWRAFDRNWLVKLLDLVGDLVGLAVDLVKRRGSGLWKHLREDIEHLVTGADFSAADFGERGFINRTWTDQNCPGPFYFAPQRESRPDVIVATNHGISPEMRLTAMNEWIALLAGGNQNDIQWRYDELNHEILEALDNAPSGIDEAAAWELIDFLRPNGRFPTYYNHGNPADWPTVQVHGSVTLCELTEGVMTSRFGYYGDDPVTIHLERYLR